jgi:hydrogenase maturation factor
VGVYMFIKKTFAIHKIDKAKTKVIIDNFEDNVKELRKRLVIMERRIQKG